MGVARLLSFLSGLLILSGCAYQLVPKENQLVLTSRFEEVVELVEPRVQGKASNWDLYHLCFAYQRLNNYSKLFWCLDKIEANIAAGETGMFLYDLRPEPSLLRAEVYADLGQFDKAIFHGEKGLKIVEEVDAQRQQRLRALANLGLAHALNGDRVKTQYYRKQLEGIGTHYPFNALVDEKFLGLARIHMAFGRYEEALEASEKATLDPLLGFADLVSGANLAGESIWVFRNLPKNFMHAKALFALGRYSEAKQEYDKLLAHPRTASNGGIHWLILYDRGRIARSEGDLPKAIALLKQAIEVIEWQRGTITSEASKIGFVGKKQSLYSDLVELLVEINQVQEAFTYAERGKARALVDLLASKTDFASISNQAEASTDSQSQNQKRQLLAQLKTAQEERSLVTTSQEKALTRTRAIDKVRVKLETVDAELASLVSVSSLGVEDVQELLDPNEILLEYFYTSSDRLVAFVVSRNSVDGFVLDGKGLNQAVKNFRTALAAFGDDRWRPHATALYERLIAPLRQQLKSSELVIVAHGALHYIPFYALVSDQGQLIDDFAIRQLPSASVLRFLAKEHRAPENMLILGNPDLNDPQYDLPGAEAEALTISSQWTGAQLLMRKSASETAVKQKAGRFRILHFASHGQFSAERPLKSGLLLAPDSSNDGLLSVDELYGLSLNADMVTLSACETGLGAIANGDDVVGLNRGFLYAGARSIVSSLWQVSDESTKFLMSRFYQELERTDRRSALRLAQLETRKRYPHPLFWAAFQVTGGL